MGLSTILFHPENDVPLLMGFGLVTSLILIFKKWGNLLISGNLLSAVLFAILAPSVFETGGLYSDNLLWLLVVPLVTLLITNRFSGFIWTGILLAMTYYVFHLENSTMETFRVQIQDLPASYFFTSYLMFFAVIVGIVFIFAKGQEDTIKNLQQQQELLLRQKAEITRQADSLRKAQIQLKNSNAELDTFAFAASHDLKEPLRMIKLYTQLTAKRLDQHLDENTREFMGYVTDGVTRMQKLLDDLLNYSRLGYQNEGVKSTNLNDILFDVVNNLSATIQDTETAIFINTLPKLNSSSTEMTQLFQNLLSNSIKFRKKNIQPEIHINHRLDGDNHLISVKDNGIGIAKEHQEKVFGVFERLHARGKYEGSGIGLATCKKIVEKMNGKIWANSEVGEGTTFYMTFPYVN
ncbi:MAG: signal transduction histidine kinase [Saprospiraceae bacterium]|jgi:signal transduction histidine kinase